MFPAPSLPHVVVAWVGGSGRRAATQWSGPGSPGPLSVPLSPGTWRLGEGTLKESQAKDINGPSLG